MNVITKNVGECVEDEVFAHGECDGTYEISRRCGKWLCEHIASNVEKDYVNAIVDILNIKGGIEMNMLKGDELLLWGKLTQDMKYRFEANAENDGDTWSFKLWAQQSGNLERIRNGEDFVIDIDRDDEIDNARNAAMDAYAFVFTTAHAMHVAKSDASDEELDVLMLAYEEASDMSDDAFNAWCKLSKEGAV